MSTLFFERPWALLFYGLAMEVGLAVALWLSGRTVLLRAMAAVFLFTLAAIGVERLVVTNREQINLLLEQDVHAVFARDTAGVLATIDPSAAVLRQTVSQMLARGHVDELKITHQEILVHDGAAPATATVKLIARIKAQLPGMSASQGLVPVVLELRRSDGWKISRADYDRSALPKGMGS